MSNQSTEEMQKEVDEMEKQLTQQAEEQKARAANEAIEPQAPDPDSIAPQAPEAAPSQPEPVAQQPSAPVTPAQDDPMEWAKKKGLKSPEDMARLLRQREQEFHESRQKDAEKNKIQFQPPQAPTWNPQPDMGYPYPSYSPQPPPDLTRQLGQQYNVDPEDVRRVMPMIVDAAQAIARREVSGVQAQMMEIQRANQRNNELMSLMQDPAFTDVRVQKEIHEVLDSDPSIYQRERTPMAAAYQQAMINLARKQLQQGATVGSPAHTNMPPVTAGGGTGGFSGQAKITEKDFDRWNLKDQEAYLRSNGRILPKK